MPYVINDDCIGSRELACVAVCPVDCIYEGSVRLWIHPEECIDCGACEPECPVAAIIYAGENDGNQDLEEARAFFHEPLPGRAEPLGSPGGAKAIGNLRTDIPRLMDRDG